MALQGWALAAPRHVIETAGRGPELYDGVLPTEAGDGDQLGVSFRSPFAGARSLGRAAGAQAACDLIRHMKDARRSGEGLALIPLTNRRNRPRRKWTPVARRGPAACGLRLGNAKTLGQKPAKSRGFRRWPEARPISLCNSRLVGGESGIRTHGTFRYTRFPSVRLQPLGHLSAQHDGGLLVR